MKRARKYLHVWVAVAAIHLLAWASHLGLNVSISPGIPSSLYRRPITHESAQFILAVTMLLLGASGICIPVLCSLAVSWCIKRLRPYPRTRCRKCGYDLRATPDRCPECGTIPPSPPAGGSMR